jgi:hypothetical protein
MYSDIKFCTPGLSSINDTLCHLLSYPKFGVRAPKGDGYLGEETEWASYLEHLTLHDASAYLPNLSVSPAERAHHLLYCPLVLPCTALYRGLNI